MQSTCLKQSTLKTPQQFRCVTLSRCSVSITWGMEQQQLPMYLNHSRAAEDLGQYNSFSVGGAGWHKCGSAVTSCTDLEAQNLHIHTHTLEQQCHVNSCLKWRSWDVFSRAWTNTLDSIYTKVEGALKSHRHGPFQCVFQGESQCRSLSFLSFPSMTFWKR